MTDSMKMGSIAIVVPCYNEEEVLPETTSRLAVVLDKLIQEGLASSVMVILVDDGSRDRTWSLTLECAQRDARFQGIRLSRNVGHQRALLAGLLAAPGDAVISIDADLQDDVNAIVGMAKAFSQGADVVYGVRSLRTRDTLFKRKSAEWYYRLLRQLGVEMIPNHADFRLLSRRAIEALRGFREANLFLRGIIPLLGFHSEKIYYERLERFAGESKYPLRKMIALAWNGVSSFSAVPLRLITVTGTLVATGSLLLSAWALWTRIFTSRATPGWASVTVPLLFLGGIQLLAIGVIGEYLSKIFLEVKARPRYLIEASTLRDYQSLG